MKTNKVIAKLHEASWVTEDPPNSVSKQGDTTFYNMVRQTDDASNGPEMYIQLQFSTDNELIAIEFGVRNNDAQLEGILGIQGIQEALSFLCS